MRDWDSIIHGKYWWIFFLASFFGILFFGYVIGFIIFVLGLLFTVYAAITNRISYRKTRSMSVDELQEYYFSETDEKNEIVSAGKKLQN